MGPLAVTQAFLPLVRRGRGRIVLVGSIGSRRASPIAGPYNASKSLWKPWPMPCASNSDQKLHVALIRPVRSPHQCSKRLAPTVTTWSRVSQRRTTSLPGYDTSGWRCSQQLEKHAIPPEKVACAIAHAPAARPKTHYLVGIDARVQALVAWLLPTRLRDALILRLLRLPT